MVSYNPACYLPSAAHDFVPSSLACPPPPSYIQSTYEAVTSPFGSTFTAIRAGMDALMSLPLLSFLLIPTMTSWGTSLNLLFFYLTWSTLVLSHPPLRVEYVASLAIKVLFYVLPSVLFLTFDVIFPGISEGFKSVGSTALPFKNISRRNSPKHMKTIGWSLFNILLGVALQALIEYTLVRILERKSALKVTTTLPLPWAILKDLLRGLLARDLLTWLIHHSLLHNPNGNHLTRDLSRLHASWYHRKIRAPFPLSPSYDHPLIYILRVFIPQYAPAYLWRFHLLTYILYLLLISLEETFTHSGYTHIPTNFVLGGIARRNDLHCLTNGEGNFGTTGIIDWIMGTTIGGDIAEEIMLEIEEAQIEEKAQQKIKKGVKRVKAAGSRSNTRRRNDNDDDNNDNNDENVYSRRNTKVKSTSSSSEAKEVRRRRLTGGGTKSTAIAPEEVEAGLKTRAKQMPPSSRSRSRPRPRPNSNPNSKRTGRRRTQEDSDYED